MKQNEFLNFWAYLTIIMIAWFLTGAQIQHFTFFELFTFISLFLVVAAIFRIEKVLIRNAERAENIEVELGIMAKSIGRTKSKKEESAKSEPSAEPPPAV